MHAVQRYYTEIWSWSVFWIIILEYSTRSRSFVIVVCWLRSIKNCKLLRLLQLLRLIHCYFALIPIYFGLNTNYTHWRGVFPREKQVFALSLQIPDPPTPSVSTARRRQHVFFGAVFTKTKMLFANDIFCLKTKRVCLSIRTIDSQLRGYLSFFLGSQEFSMYRPTKKKRPVSSVVKTSLLVREVWGSRPGPVKSNTMSPVTRHRCDISSNFEVV